MNNYKIKIGITQGDINGVGYELIIKTLSDARILDFCTPVIYGSQKAAAYHCKTIEDCICNPQIISDISELNSRHINLINCTDENIKVEFGQASDDAGRAAYQSLERAAQDLKNGQIDALITAPLNKNTIPADKNFDCQRRFFEDLLDEKGQALLLVVNDVARIAVAAPSSKEANRELILEKLRKLKKCLLEDFSINLPRIAVLKPGEDDEPAVTAIKEAENEGIICVLYDSNEFFESGKFEKFDAVLAVNDAQAKMFLRENDVRFTAGLPVVRTAPAQGVDYGNAGKNLTSEEAFRNALYLACDVFRSRKFFEEISANPLVVKNKK